MLAAPEVEFSIREFCSPRELKRFFPYSAEHLFLSNVLFVGDRGLTP